MTNNKSSNNADGPNDAKGLAILFADDERSLQELMKLEIPRMGHRVTVCPDGLTAAAALEKDTFDCLLVDLDMPGLNGIDVIARAKGAVSRCRGGRADRQVVARDGHLGVASRARSIT